MTSRERVRAVLNHQIPDRVPNGLGGCETSGLHVLTYDNLQKMLGCERKPPKIDSCMCISVFEEPVLKAIDGDILMLASHKICEKPYRGDIEDQWKEETLWGRTFSIPQNVNFRENSDGSLTWKSHMWNNNAVLTPKSYYFEHRSTTNLMAEFHVPNPKDFCPSHSLNETQLRELENTAKRLYEETDFSLSLGEWITNLQVQPGGFAGHMILMMEEPDIMREILDRHVDAALKQLEMLDQAVGKYVDLVSMVQDIGDDRGVTIGAPLWREIYKPAYKKLFQGWRKITNMKINFHSCGSVEEIMGDFIECGVHVFNPVQTSAAGMDPKHLKEKYGKDIIFWGGAYDAKLVNPQATYEEVYQTVYRNIKTLAAGGNYIFSGVHNMPGNLPDHHLKAMLDAYYDARTYS